MWSPQDEVFNPEDPCVDRCQGLGIVEATQVDYGGELKPIPRQLAYSADT